MFGVKVTSCLSRTANTGRGNDDYDDDDDDDDDGEHLVPVSTRADIE